MVIQSIHGALVTSKNQAGELQELTAELVHRGPSTVGTYTDVSLSCKLDGQKHIFETISFHHPRDYQLTLDNWPSFLAYQMKTRPSHKHSLTVDKLRTVQHQHIDTMSDIGVKAFRIYLNDKGDYKIILITPKEIDKGISKGIQVIGPIVFHSKLGEQIKSFQTFIRHDGVFFKPWDGKGSERDPVNFYVNMFKRPLDIEDYLSVYLNDHHRILKDPARYQINPKNPRQMVFKNLGEFTYLESNDGKLMVTFEKEPHMKANASVFRLIDFLKLDETQKLHLVEQFVRLSREVMTDDDAILKVTNVCVEFGKRLQAILLSGNGEVEIMLNDLLKDSPTTKLG